MTTAKRLTDLMIERQRPASTERSVIWDLVEPGLGVRVGAKRKTFILKMRIGVRQPLVTLGHFPALGIADARSNAREVRNRSQIGHNPSHKAVTDSKRSTVSDLVEEYIEGHAKPNQRSWKDTAGHLRNNLSRMFGKKPVSAVSRSDILQILDSLRARNVRQGANRVLAHSKRFFGWCVERGLIDQSPVVGIRPPYKEQARDRVLEDEEVARIWQALQTIGFPIGPAVQMLLLTGQRRDEVSHMCWRELDFLASIWTIPADRNKSARPHLVPLSKLALEIIEQLPQTDGHVFWGRSPDRAINGWSKAKQRIDEASGVTDWRIHDLRRTAATGMARLGFDPHIVERVLNHASSSAGPLARVYQRYAYEDEKRAALEAWAGNVRKLVSKNC